VALEGKLSRQVVDDATNRGQRPDGDLIPWTMKAFCEDFPQMTGVRIVRIAIHPEMQGMGYGTRAIQQLMAFYSNCVGTNPISDTALLNPLTDCSHEHIDYFGVSFGLTGRLLKFWKGLGLKPVYISQKVNATTGEHSAIVIRQVGEECDWLEELCAEFRMVFGRLLGSDFREFDSDLCEEIFSGIEFVNVRDGFTAADDSKLQMYSKQQCDFSVVHALFVRLCEFYFDKCPEVALTRIMKKILPAIGFQGRSITECADGMGLSMNQLYAQLQRIAGLFADYLSGIVDMSTLTRKKSATA
jgi:N-acetyltransferase 10